MKICLSLFCAVLMLLAVVASAQKLGHINSADLLAAMPEGKGADSVLQAYQKSLEDEYSSMASEYQTKLEEYTKTEKTLPDAVKEVKQQELSDLQNRIQQFEGGAQDKLQAKKEEIYSPIIKKAEDAVKAVAKENGYAYIFDSSFGAVLYAEESRDIMALVKKKLGLK
jgi:outer membrane protein